MTDPRRELYELVRSARAWVEWQQEAGADALAAVLGTQPDARRAARVERPDGAPGGGRDATPRATLPERAPPPQPPPPAPSPERAVTASSLPVAEKRQRLAVLAERVAGCKACALHTSRKQTVFARGDPNAEICFVGEGPGAEEDAQGAPFVGAAGQLLDKMIAGMGLARDAVYVANIVKCRPPQNRQPEPKEMASCLPYLAEQIELVRPAVIVALGGTALTGLFGPGEGITRARGSWRLYRGSIPVMPTFHPAYVLRQPTAGVKSKVWSDLKQVLAHLGRPIPKR